jgi:hypothetical protein
MPFSMKKLKISKLKKIFIPKFKNFMVRFLFSFRKVIDDCVLKFVCYLLFEYCYFYTKYLIERNEK